MTLNSPDKNTDNNFEYNPSSEQCEIIQAISDGNNVICDAVAGSGKTTTVLWLAKKMPNSNIIQITYNAQLKLEVRAKVQQKNLDNLEIHTYHSLAVKYYDRAAYEDSLMRAIVNKIKEPDRNIPKYDIVVLDEVQDMTLLYYRLICKFITDIGNKISIVMLGDKYQGVYQFKGADTRFLTLASKIWPNYTPIKHLSLQTSYRVTKPIAWFVNKVMLGEQRIISNKEGPVIEFIHDDIFKVHLTLIPKILALLKDGAYEPGDIFVLAASIKSSRVPVRKLENALVKNKIPCYVPISDDKKIDEDVTRGKVIFTTFHQAKGRERKVVIVYGFDDSYFNFYEKNLPNNVCPSTLYVAVTRASEKLFLLEGSRNKPFVFLKKTHDELAKSSKINYITGPSKNNKSLKTSEEKPLGSVPYQTTPTELVKFLSEDTMDMILPIINELFCVETEPSKAINIPSKVESDNGKCEEVSDLNGLVIPAMFQEKYSITHENSLMEYIDQERNNLEKHQFLADAIKNIKSPCITPNDYLYLGNVYTAIREKLYFKLAQIDNYEWLTDKMIASCHAHMAKNLSDKLVYEKQMPSYIYTSKDFGKIEFNARIDAFDNRIVWEFKCTNELTTEHLLQLAIYAWLWTKSSAKNNGTREFKIINIRTGEVRRLKQRISLLNDIIDILLKNKFGKDEIKTDNKFIQNCISNKILDTYKHLCKIGAFKKKNVVKYLLSIGVKSQQLKLITNTNDRKKLLLMAIDDPAIFDTIIQLTKVNGTIIEV